MNKSSLDLNPEELININKQQINVKSLIDCLSYKQQLLFVEQGNLQEKADQNKATLEKIKSITAKINENYKAKYDRMMKIVKKL